MSDVIGSMSMPLDSDGFLRRECPHCSQEFKWLHNDSESEREMEPGGYHCPYCDGRSVDGWWTRSQFAAIEDETAFFAESQIHEMFKGMERQSNQFLKIKAGSAPRRRKRPLTEPDDMKRIDFACHPAEPLKVLEDWSERVHCLVCGRPAA
jgi:DNA-directed RNA polymerase subunit RPC12/RpoP